MNQKVIEMQTFQSEGNIIPHAWYKTIRKENGKTDLLALCILADICYWYKPTIIRDETTGDIKEIKQKFSGDMLQKSYKSYADFFGESKRKIKASFDLLESFGLIKREFRKIETKTGLVMNNVMFIDINVKKIKAFSIIHENTHQQTISYKVPPKNDPTPLQKNTIGLDEKIPKVYAENGGTNTEITTENTTKNTTNNHKAPSEKNRSAPPPEEPIFKIPLIKNKNKEDQFHLIYQRDIDDWKEIYPAVDVENELRKIVGWNKANPTKRKTPRGILRHINSWLAKAQDSGRNNPSKTNTNTQVDKTASFKRVAEKAWARFLENIDREDYTSDDKLTLKAINQIGGMRAVRMWTNQEIPYRRKDFIDIYTSLLEENSQ